MNEILRCVFTIENFASFKCFRDVRTVKVYEKYVVNLSWDWANNFTIGVFCSYSCAASDIQYLNIRIPIIIRIFYYLNAYHYSNILASVYPPLFE